MSVMTRRTSVFLLDDHDVVREGLRWLLEGVPDFEVVGEAATAISGYEGMLRTTPDVAIVDSALPDGSGVTVIREVRSRLPATKCIVFTSFPEDEAMYAAMLAGAVGFLSKSTRHAQVLETLRRVVRGESQLRPTDVEALRRRADMLGDDLLLRKLTGQEGRILEMMTEGATNREIAGRLNVAEKTIRNYVSVILAKLGMRNRTEAAVYLTQRRHEQRTSNLLRQAG